MALFEREDTLALALAPDLSPEVREQLRGMEFISVLSDELKTVAPDAYVYAPSEGPRGIALQTVTLRREAQGFFRKLFHIRTKVYVLSLAWHIDADPIVIRPPSGVPPISLRLRVLQSRRFLGEGTEVFPARTIRGGIGVQIQLWESRQAIRDFGAVMSEIEAESSASHLYDILAVAAATAIAQPTAAPFFDEAAKVLAGSVVKILENRGDKALDVFGGFYDARGPWHRLDEYSGDGVDVTLNLF
jgi:hypothetical protein